MPMDDEDPNKRNDILVKSLVNDQGSDYGLIIIVSVRKDSVARDGDRCICINKS